MDYNNILKAINEGVKASLIDFSNNKILKSLIANNDSYKLVLINKIDNWLVNSCEHFPNDLYNELCKSKNIGLYEVDDILSLNTIINRLILETLTGYINLNWLDISDISQSEFSNEFSIEELNIGEYQRYASGGTYTLDILNWNINHIYTDMFSSCNYLGSIILPNVETIDEDAFYRCLELKSVKLPESLVSINDCAFWNCLDLLENITIPKSVKYIQRWAFHGCLSLKTINYLGTINDWNHILKDPTMLDNKKPVLVKCIDKTINII